MVDGRSVVVRNTANGELGTRSALSLSAFSSWYRLPIGAMPTHRRMPVTHYVPHPRPSVSIGGLHRIPTAPEATLPGPSNIQNAMSGFQTVHTLPTRSGPGLRVGLPGTHPEGMTSPVSRVCWNART